MLISLVLGTWFCAREYYSVQSPPISKGKKFKVVLPATPVTRPPPVFKLPPRPPEITKITKARVGDTFLSLLIKAGVDRPSAHMAIRALSKSYRPRDLKRGQEVRITFQPNFWGEKSGPFVGFNFTPRAEETFKIRTNGIGGYTLKKINIVLENTDVLFSGSIKTSLYPAAIKSGMAASSLVNLIRLFSWDVDFQRDIQKNDKFDVLVEKLYQKNGKFARWGRILYAELTLSRKPIRLYRFESKRHGVEYFDDRGHSAQKALMKTPIDGARLSSGYGRRRHPILGYTKVHRGVDFAAPRGTPIYAAGNGVIRYAGRKGAYGKYIKIRHNAQYSTAYAHLHQFRRGIRRGRRVTQGQVIGYVGSTGRSTGPHLHYEIIVNGRQTNPLRLKLPSGRRLKGRELKRFTKIRDRLNIRLRKLIGPITNRQFKDH